MKVLCTQHVDLRVPVEQVFDYVADIARWPMWLACVVSAQQPQGQPLDLDAEIRVCLHAGRRRWQESFEVTRCIRNAFLSFEAPLSATRRIDFRFERRGPLTRLACSIGYPVFGGMLPLMVDALFRRQRIKHELRDSLIHIKNMMEESATGANWVDDERDWQPARVGAQPLTSQKLRVV